MARVRLAAHAALSIMLVCAGVASAGPDPGAGPGAAPAATVGWPPSPGLLVAEVVTGGASASDEYVEVTNASGGPIDLAGLELVYVTSTGGTVTRKASWSTSLVLDPGRHLLVANSAGTFAAIADATYSGGFAATGGAVVLRAIGGAPVDAVGWGDAVNAFVETTPAMAPPPGSSIERLPGGALGNAVDTNDNAADFVVNPSPEAQNLTAPPTPSPSPSTSPSPAPTPTPTPIPSPASTPSPAPTPTPTPTLPPATPSPSPSPTPTTVPSPAAPIASVRTLPDGVTATVEGVLTIDLGSIDGSRGGFVQDATAGIELYLDAALPAVIPAGTIVRATGTTDTRYAQETLRVGVGELVVLGTGPIPEPAPVDTAVAGDGWEGSRLELRGTITDTPTALADGLGITIDDGSGPVRVIAGSAALGSQAPATGALVVARGPLGQRDSTGAGTSGYRLYAMLPGDLEIGAPPPSPTPTSSPTPTASPSPTPTPAPTANPGSLAPDVASARSVAIGDGTRVRGVVVAEAGRLGTPPILVIGDATGGLPVRLSDDAARPARGAWVEVQGVIAEPYGQTELRATNGGVLVLGTASTPVPLPIAAVDAGEATEGRLVTLHGTISVSAAKTTSADLVFTITDDAGGTVRGYADASAGFDPASLRKGLVAEFTGIVGQRASRKGALDGYRLWIRDPGDVRVDAPAPSTVPSSSPPWSVVAIRAAAVLDGLPVVIEGVVTAGPGLLDASRRRIVVEDGTGAIEVLLATASTQLQPGLRVRVVGTVGRAYGAPRVRADEVSVLGAARPTIRALRSQPGASLEWTLVRVSGTVAEVHRLGARWRAELVVDGRQIPVAGVEGSGIESTALVAGRPATVTGIVRRAYPTASDQRYSVVPRSPADIVLGPPTGASAASGGSGSGGGAGTVAAPSGTAIAASVQDVDLVTLEAHVGQQVRAGGLVTGLRSDGFDLDDGTAVARVMLAGNAADLLALVEPGDAVAVVGRPRRQDTTILIVDDPAGLQLAGDLDMVSAAGEAVGRGDQAVPAGSAPPEPPGRGSAVAAVAEGMRLDAGTAGAGTLALVAALSVLVTIARRHRARQALQARIVARLTSMGFDRRSGHGGSGG